MKIRWIAAPLALTAAIVQVTVSRAQTAGADDDRLQEPDLRLLQQVDRAYAQQRVRGEIDGCRGRDEHQDGERRAA